MPVETKPPAVYRKQLEASLTPVEAILKLPVASMATGDSGIILLDERLVAVDDQGRRTIAWHFAYKTLTHAGIKTNGEDVYTFNKRQQKAYLVLAETIQPDGTRHRVQPNAVLVQTPQRQAQYSLYDDQAELKLIFPDVRVGSITHGIVVIEDLIATVPGEFCQNFSWGSSWAKARIRYAITLPKALDARLKVEPLGTGVPARKTAPAGTGRISHTWALDDVPGERYEPGRAPPSQVGPSLQLSTVPDWGSIGAWYRGLLQGRGELKPALAAQVDEWCKDATAPADVLAILHARVADDVRYVGLEFGAAAYQPNDCNEVWALRYGDCKDKANLLVAMLRHRGIAAGVALVNTEHLGLLNRRLPSYQLFDHAIVAVPQPDGSHVFCDPTIAYSTPGMIGTRSADRDVLIITGTGDTWARTPSVSAGSLLYAFDLKLSETGELSGWFTETAEGNFGAYERRRYLRLEPEDVRSKLSEIIRGFYPGAEVIDASLLPSERSAPYSVKVYFTVPGTSQEAGHKQTLVFPAAAGMLPNLGTSADRQSTYFLDRERIRFDVTVALPPGIQGGQPPPEFRVDAGSAAFRANWSIRDGQCRAELDIEIKDAAVRRDDFGRLYQARQSLLAWLERPLVLEAGAVANRNPASVDIDFPLMPTGDGQITLADNRYPLSGNAESRRLALERTIQYFPQDANTVFRAGTRLAVLDWNHDRNEVAHERVARLLSAYAGQVTAENYGWAQNVDGLILRDLGRTAEAQALLLAVSRDGNLSIGRRATVAPEAAALLAKTDAPAAIKLLEEIAALPNGATTAVESRLALLYLEAGRGPDLAAHLQDVARRRPDTVEEEFTRLVEASNNWPESAATEPPAFQLAAIVSVLVPKPAEALRTQLTKVHAAHSSRLVRAALTTALARPPLAEWNTPAAPQTLEQYDKAIADADEKKDSIAGFRASLQSLVHFGADPGFPRRLWRAANYADWAERQKLAPVAPAVADALLALCDQLPAGDNYYLEGKLLRCSRLHRAGNYAEEVALLEPLLKSRDLEESYFLAITRKLAAARESQGNLAEAVRLYATVEALVPTYRSAADCTLRATFIHLHFGRDADALHTLDVLRKAPASIVQQMAGGAQVKELLALQQTGQAEAVWQHGRGWWPRWRKLAEPHLGAADTPAGIIPVINDLGALGTELGEAKRDKDNIAYFKLMDQVMGAARWLPSYGTEISSLYNITAGMVPAQAADFRLLAIAILEGPHPAEIENAAAARIQLAIHYIDGGQAAKALPVAREFIRQPPSGGPPMVPAMARLWGLAAQAAKADLPEATAALEKSLEDPTLADHRGAGVTILADLYHQQGRQADELQLLKREIANPVIAATPATLKPLESRLEALTGERELAAEVTRWRTALGLPWYDYADPASLDDPRLSDLNAVLAEPDNYFGAAEKIKLNLLVAQDDHLPLTQRQGAIRGVANLLLQWTPTWTQFEQVAGSVVDNAAFDTETRLSTLWLTLVYSASAKRFDVYRRWRPHVLTERFNETYTANLAILDAWVAHDPYSADSLLALAAEQGKSEISLFRGFLLTDIISALVNLGDFAAAEKFIALMPGWRTGPDFKGTLQARQLEYTRQLRVAKMQARIHEQLVTLVKERYPVLPAELPAAYRDLRIGGELPICTPAETVQACLYLIGARQFDRQDLDFWGTFVRNLPRTPENDAFGCKLMAAAMSAAETDELKNQVLTVFSSNIDLDEPAVFQAMEQMLAGGLDPAKYPSTALQAKLGAMRLADRQGKLGDLDAFFYGYNNPVIPFVKQTQNLSIHLRARDLEALQRDIDGLDAQLVFDPSFVAEVVPALELLDRKEELAAAREVIRAELKKTVAQSWLAQDSPTIAKVGRFAEALKDPALVPAAWGADLARSLTDPFRRLEVRIIAAFVHDDWEALALASAEMNRDYPTHYHYYWWRAVAEEKRGQVAAAQQALKVYIKYCRDERQHPEAVAMLKRLEGTAP